MLDHQVTILNRGLFNVPYVRLHVLNVGEDSSQHSRGVKRYLILVK